MEPTRWHADPIEELAPGVGRQTLHGEGVTVARFHLAAGAGVPLHAHHNEQVTTVLAGRLRLVVDGDEVVLGSDESLLVPPDLPHEAEALEDSLVLEVFAPRREDWLAG